MEIIVVFVMLAILYGVVEVLVETVGVFNFIFQIRGQVFPVHFCATRYYLSFDSKSQLLVSWLVGSLA